MLKFGAGGEGKHGPGANREVVGVQEGWPCKLEPSVCASTALVGVQQVQEDVVHVQIVRVQIVHV